MRAVGLAGALLLLGVVCAASLAVGARSIAPGAVLDALGDSSTQEGFVVRELRAPRTLLGLMVGVALGLSGALLQGLTRNPLADPSILGISAGAALAAAVAVLVAGVSSVYGYIWFAFAGAAVVGVAVYAIASAGRERATPVKLALAGAAITALLTSATSLVLVLDLATFNTLRFWLVGSLAGRGSAVAAQTWPFVAVGALAAIAATRSLNALALGDDVARAQGLRLGPARAFTGAAALLLAAAATAAAGPIVFVGLAVPHVARAIAGPDYRWVIPYSAVLAPILLLACDIAGRVVSGAGETQVGVVTAFVGAPFFVALVRRRRLVSL